jgi:hypothetical protein
LVGVQYVLQFWYANYEKSFYKNGKLRQTSSRLLAKEVAVAQLIPSHFSINPQIFVDSIASISL